MTRSHRIEFGPFGPLIQVGLNVGATQAGMGLGGPPQSRIGLIDTGATRTAISGLVYRLLRPASSGAASYRRPGQAEVVEVTYAVGLNFEGHLTSNPWFDVDVVVADPATPGVEVLVGMDVLSRLVLFYEGAKRTMILAY